MTRISPLLSNGGGGGVASLMTQQPWNPKKNTPGCYNPASAAAGLAAVLLDVTIHLQQQPVWQPSIRVQGHLW